MAGALEIAHELRRAVNAGDALRVRASVRRLLELGGQDRQVRFTCGAALLFVDDAAAGLALLPPDEHLMRAKALASLGRFADALRECAAADSDPFAREVRTEILARANSAGAVISDIVASLPDDLQQIYEQGSELFKAGRELDAFRRFNAMFDRYEPWRIGAGRLERLGKDNLPRWQGEPVSHLLVISNGGSGDFFQFCRFLRAARQRCGRLTVCAAHSLHGIARRLAGVDEVLDLGAINVAVQAADAYATTFTDLALATGEIWGPSCYIAALPQRTAALDRTARHVGLCWSASSIGAERSIPFSHLAKLRELRGIVYHSLQVGAAEAHAGAWVQRWSLSDYEDTAGLIAALDDVVTVDTSVAHLAAAMGKRTHLILTSFEDWRWGVGDTTPWYPSMSIYRGNVAGSIKKLRAALGGY